MNKLFLITYSYIRTNRDPLIVSGSVSIAAPSKDAAIARCLLKDYIPRFIDGEDIECWEQQK